MREPIGKTAQRRLMTGVSVELDGASSPSHLRPSPFQLLYFDLTGAGALRSLSTFL